MKVSELIVQLQAALELEGDLSVWTVNSDEYGESYGEAESTDVERLSGRGVTAKKGFVIH